MSHHICHTPDCAIAISKASFPVAMNCPVCQQPLSLVEERSALSEEDEQLIDSLPYVIAYPLKRTLLEKHAGTKVNLFKDTFLNYLKYLGLLTASEFFNSPFKDKKMVALFHQTLAQPSFGSWNQYIRETLNYLIENQHNFFCPDILAYYEFVETGKKRKLFKGEIESIDSNGDVQIKKQEATAIGMLIYFRNRYLGHGLTLDEGASQKLWDEYYPIFKDLLEKLTLAIHYPMFKHEHGESYLLSSAEISPIEKGLQTPGRVWIENKDGKSMDILPFFVVPGEVSIGKEEKEQILTYESYTGKTIKFFSPEGTEKQTSGDILEKLNLLLRDKQKEQPYLTETFTKEVFLTRIADENKLILDTLISEKKVIPGVYVHREEMEIKLREWIGARANIFFIAAEAGSGKTNLLVEMQKQYGERGLPSLLIRANRMEKQSLKEQIAYLLNLDSSLGLKNYSAISGTQAEPTFILIDGLNEASNAEEIWQEVLELSQIFVAGSLKFVITSRANSKADIERYKLTKADEIFIYGEYKERENGLAAFVYWLTPLNMVEMKAAWEDYVKKDKNKFKPLFSFDDLATFDRALYNQISTPLVLRLFLETYYGKKLPQKGNQHLNIWKDWLATFTSEEQTFMELLAAEVWEKGENELLLDDLLKHETLKSYFTSDLINAPYHRLKNLGWISRYVKDLNSYVSFTVEGALLYLLGDLLSKKQSILELDNVLDIISEKNKLKSSAIEEFLVELSLKGNLSLIMSIIKFDKKNGKYCIRPILNYLKRIYSGESNTWHSTGSPLKSEASTICRYECEALIRMLLENKNTMKFLLEIEIPIIDSQLTPLKMDFYEACAFLIHPRFKVETIEIIELGFRANNIIKFETDISYSGWDLEGIKSIATNSRNRKLFFEIGEYLLGKADNYISYRREEDLNQALYFFQKSLTPKNLKQGISNNFKIYTRIGKIFSLLDKNDKSEYYFEKCLQIVSNTFDSFNYDEADLYKNLSLLNKKKGDFDKAEFYFQKCVKVICEKNGTFHISLALTYDQMASFYNDLNDYKNGVKYLKKCLQIQQKILNYNHSDILKTITRIGHTYFVLNDYFQALRHFQECLKIQLERPHFRDYLIPQTYFSLGECEFELGEYENAIELLLKGFELYKKGGFPFQIAKCYEALSDYVKALDYYIQSATIRKEDPEVGLEAEATQESISNAKRLAKELGKENELPDWMKDQ